MKSVIPFKSKSLKDVTVSEIKVSLVKNPPVGFHSSKPLKVDPEAESLDSFVLGVVNLFSLLTGEEWDCLSTARRKAIDSETFEVDLMTSSSSNSKVRKAQRLFFDVTEFNRVREEKARIENEKRKDYRFWQFGDDKSPF